MSYAPAPAFERLFSVFTSAPDSIGAHLTRRMTALGADAPLMVVTGTDVVLFPGGGQPPRMESFRRTTRGFIEITGVSHLGIAVPWILRLRELGDPQWRLDAERLIAQMEEVRAANTEDLWRETVGVTAWIGLEEKIADLVDYACAVTAAYLRQGLADESILTIEHFRTHYLDPVGSADVPVPINDMMVATFALAFLDIAHRITGWLRAQVPDWERLMVLLCGPSGRPTAGLTWATNNMCHLLWRASEGRLAPERLYIAPHAPSLAVDDLRENAQLESTEAAFRKLWFNIRGGVDIGRQMFPDYPGYRTAIDAAPIVDDETRMLAEMPAVASAADRRAFVTRLRFVMEDPRQLISNAAAHYIIDSLAACGNDPAKVVIPFFTDIAYPRRK